MERWPCLESCSVLDCVPSLDVLLGLWCTLFQLEKKLAEYVGVCVEFWWLRLWSSC